MFKSYSNLARYFVTATNDREFFLLGRNPRRNNSVFH